VIMPLIESAKLDGHDPAAYLKDVFERLPTLKNADLHLLLPHLWTAPPATTVPNAASPAFAQAATPQHVAGDGARVGWPSAYRHLRPDFAKAMPTRDGGRANQNAASASTPNADSTSINSR